MPVIKIDVQKDCILEQGNGYILIKPRYYAEFAEVAYIAVMSKANTAEEFHDEKNKCNKTGKLFVGQNGGITFNLIRRD